MASAVENIPYNGMTIDVCAAKIRRVIPMLGWRFQGERPGEIFASVPLSFWSWGEDVHIRFFQDHFSIESKCVMPLQIIDWGRNKSNIRKFISAYYNA